MKLDFMRLSILFCLSIALLGCNHEAKDASLMDQDLSGTWLQKQHEVSYDKTTGEYLYTLTIEVTIIFEDDPTTGLLYHVCWDYGGVAETATKTETRLYINGNSTVFESIGPGVLETGLERMPERLYQPNVVIDRYFRLEKLTPDVIIDKGSLVIDGPITVSESDNVCVWHSYTDVNTKHTFDLMVPYDNNNLYMRLETLSAPAAGVHNYTRYEPGAEIFFVGIISNADNFWSVTGTNLLSPAATTINITESTDSNIAGAFPIVGRAEGDYTVEFSMDTTP